MTYLGQIRNGVVVFDGSAPLADGTRVRVEPETPSASGIPGDELLRFKGLIDSESLREMSETIERDCGKVDLNEW